MFWQQSNFPGELFSDVSCPFLCILLIVTYCLVLSCSSISWESFNCFQSIFLQMFLIIIRKLIHLKNILQHPHLCGVPFWGILGSFWGMLLYSWELFTILSYKMLYRCFFCYFSSQQAKNIHSTYFYAGSIMQYLRGCKVM